MFSKMTFVSGLCSWRVLRDPHCVCIDSGKASFALANSERVAAQVGIASCSAYRLLSFAFTETDMIDLSADCVS